MKIIELKGFKRDADKLTYEDYISIVPKGTKEDYEKLTGRKPIPHVKEVIKEDHGVINDLQEIAGNDEGFEIEEKVIKNKGKSNKK